MDEKGYKLIIEELIKLLDSGVYIVDEDGIGMFYNEAMSKLEETPAAGVVGIPFQKAFPGFNLPESTLYQALRKGVSTINKTQAYKNMYGKDIMTVNSTVPVKDGERNIAAIEVAKDITTIRSMSDTILTLQNKEIESVEVKPTIKRYTFDDLTGNSESFMQAIKRGKAAARSNASVFIYGETGTGKELMAQSIHYDSDRKKKPFLAQNCAAIPATLLEGILFGTVKGGFTGAVDRAGLFEQANGGTLLLDEINSMPYDLQSKLLRVLQENYIRRVGGGKDIPIDVRIIATVNENPLKLIEEGVLRKDLYYRLNVVGINMPPLRSRKGDIAILAEKLLAKQNERFGKELWMLSDGAIAKLESYDYPGNVRELENIIMQSVAMAEDEHILSDKLLQMPVKLNADDPGLARWDKQGPLDEYLANLEKEIIREVMIEEGGNISKAAEALSIKRQTLQHKLKKYGIRE